MKKVTYEEFLELIDLNTLALNNAEITKDHHLYFYGSKFIGLQLPDKFTFEENDTVVRIELSHLVISIWKNIKSVHFSYFDIDRL